MLRKEVRGRDRKIQKRKGNGRVERMAITLGVTSVHTHVVVVVVYSPRATRAHDTT
jgi:hypothetical protein